jgi:hypothetical protein
MSPEWTPEKMAAHGAVMRSIAKTIAANKAVYVLKGGTALMFSRGLDRFSTDLDFDTSKKLSLDAAIRDGLRKAGCQTPGIDRAKDSDVTQKLFINYQTPAGDRMRLKLEAKIRDIDIAKTESTSDGFLVYNVQTQLAQKFQAAQARGGRAPRDLYDISFLASRFPEAVKVNAEAFVTFAQNTGQLISEYASGWKEDTVLESKPIEDVALNVGVIAETLMSRKQAHQMSIPEMLREICLDGSQDAVKNAEEILDAISNRPTIENRQTRRVVRSYMRGETDEATLKRSIDTFMEREAAFRRSQGQKPTRSTGQPASAFDHLPTGGRLS